MRQTGGTVNFTGFGIDQDATRIAFITAPTTVGNNGGIIPYATVNGTDFATYDGSNSTIAAFTGYVTSLAAAVAAGPGSIVKLTGQETLTGNETITGLVLAGGAVSEAGFTLTVSSGGLVGTQGPTSSNTILGGTLAFGSAEGIITSTGGAITTINSPITGSGGLTVAGNGVVNLPNASSYTGGTTLAGGVLNVGNGAALGTGTLNLVNGFVQGLAGVTIGNALTLNNSTVTIGGVNNLTFTGPVTLNDATDGNSAATTNTVNIATTSVQTLVLTGSADQRRYVHPESGYNGSTNGSGNIPWSSSPVALAANIQAALNALAHHGSGPCTTANSAANFQAAPARSSPTPAAAVRRWWPRPSRRLAPMRLSLPSPIRWPALARRP